VVIDGVNELRYAWKRAIAPPGQEGWREAPGWLFWKSFPEQPPRLHGFGGCAPFFWSRSHPSCPGGVIRLPYNSGKLFTPTKTVLHTV
jgi:hypothetical protein